MRAVLACCCCCGGTSQARHLLLAGRASHYERVGPLRSNEQARGPEAPSTGGSSSSRGACITSAVQTDGPRPPKPVTARRSVIAAGGRQLHLSPSH
jgi:hypothetical protein